MTKTQEKLLLKTIAANIKSHRLAMGYTQEEMASGLRCTREQYANMELQISGIRLVHLYDIAAKLGVTVHNLIPVRV